MRGGRQARPGRPVREEAVGFTLLEIMVVLLLFALLAGLAVPRLMTSELDLARSEAVHFRNVLQWLADRAAQTGDRYRLRMDAAGQAYETLILVDDEFVAVQEPLVRSRRIEDNRLVMRRAPYDERRFDAATELGLDFTPFGPSDPLLVVFAVASEPESGYSVVFQPGRSRPEILDGVRGWHELR